MTGSSAEQLRRTVVKAAIPLLGEIERMSTAQIAEAAGVDEADLLAVFPDRQAIVEGCFAAMTALISAAFDPAEEVRKIGAIASGQSLAARLVEVIAILEAYHQRLRIDLSAIEHTSGWGEGQAISRNVRHFGDTSEIQQAVAAMLEPDEPRLRLPAATLAEGFLALCRLAAPVRDEEPGARDSLPARQIVDLFLHGALGEQP